jgi:acetylornithine deacetylase/succinyl-diaminopimelate desuccinylase-like protein
MSLQRALCRLSMTLLLAWTFSIEAAGAENSAQSLAQQIYKELVEIDTSTDTGNTARAADAVAARLLAAGLPRKDVQVFKPTPRKGNLVARLRGTGQRRPLLLMAHLDVVAAKREGWSTDPFKLVEKNGYYYGRGTIDDKFMAASFVAALIRFKQEGYRPARDLILVLETDEEIFDRQRHGIQWLLENQRALLDAELALNEGGTVGGLNGKPLLVAVQTSEKQPANFVLATRNRGGHSSQPRKDNAIYQLAKALDRLAQFDFPISLNETTRASLQLGAALQPPQLGQAMRALVDGTADAAALAAVSADAGINSTVRTTCVATVLQGGGVVNALPTEATATVNCRILPGETPEQTLATLQRVVADDQVKVQMEWASVSSEPSPLNTEVMSAVTQVSSRFWPGVPIIPLMSPGATDGSFLRNAGIPTYGFTGLLNDLIDVREHGRDERVSIKAFQDGQESLYQVVRLLSAPVPSQP